MLVKQRFSSSTMSTTSCLFWRGWRRSGDLDTARLGDGFVGDRGDAIEEEVDPALPVPFQPHEVEAPVVLCAVTLEEETEIEKRGLQESPVLQQEGNHQAADPPIAVEIGMNGF